MEIFFKKFLGCPNLDLYGGAVSMEVTALASGSLYNGIFCVDVSNLLHLELYYLFILHLVTGDVLPLDIPPPFFLLHDTPILC